MLQEPEFLDPLTKNIRKAQEFDREMECRADLILSPRWGALPTSDFEGLVAGLMQPSEIDGFKLVADEYLVPHYLSLSALAHVFGLIERHLPGAVVTLRRATKTDCKATIEYQGGPENQRVVVNAATAGGALIAALGLIMLGHNNGRRNAAA